ncbi:hypothetical protein B0O99DRAFT_684599 [Bisporella sp. PMI_857]|nr:hypothetical protein B0O99DRAFT_684599 [Bisporella sp. PMI_857]
MDDIHQEKLIREFPKDHADEPSGIPVENTVDDSVEHETALNPISDGVNHSLTNLKNDSTKEYPSDRPRESRGTRGSGFGSGYSPSEDFPEDESEENSDETYRSPASDSAYWGSEEESDSAESALDFEILLEYYRRQIAVKNAEIRRLHTVYVAEVSSQCEDRIFIADRFRDLQRVLSQRKFELMTSLPEHQHGGFQRGSFYRK